MKTHWICNIVCYLLLQWFHWPFSSESTIPQNWVKALPLWQVFTPRPQPHRGFPILIQLVLLSHKFRNEIPSVPSIHALFWGFFFLSIWYYIFFVWRLFFLVCCFVSSVHGNLWLVRMHEYIRIGMSLLSWICILNGLMTLAGCYTIVHAITGLVK